MKEFIQTGVFGSINLGDTPEIIKEILGEPDYYGGATRKYRTPSVWSYGDIEFFFNMTNDLSKRKLSSIHGDHINSRQILTGGAKIQLDSWIIQGGFCVEIVERELIQNEMKFEKIDWGVQDDTIRLKVGIGIELVFIIESDRNYLQSFTYFSEKFIC